nr:CoxD [Acidihalobacter sp.]
MLFYIPTGKGYPGLPSWFWTVGYIAWPWFSYLLFALWFKRSSQREDRERVLNGDHPAKGWRAPALEETNAQRSKN